MTTMVAELYDALRKAGVDDVTARAAAHAVLGIDERSRLATKADLEELRLAVKADLAELKSSLVWMIFTVNLSTMIAMTGIFAAIVKLT